MADATTMAPAAAGAAAAPGGGKLDDLMLAMDVVDTLRHQDDLVARELDDEGRETALVERLRKIYRDQGLDVPDSIIHEGVTALKDSRFVYTPPAPSLATTMARLWVNRSRIGAVVGVLVAAAGIAWFAYDALVVAPERRAAENRRIELTDTLPQKLAGAHRDVLAEAKVDAAKTQGDQLLADGRSALARNDADGARKALAGMEALRAKLRQTYSLIVVSRPGEQSGVFRVPNRNTNARNHYVIVEAVGPDGQPIPMPITSEEDGSSRTVSKWGVRVSQAVFDGVRADKEDDGIIQRNRFGDKRRGMLDVDYAVPVQGGAITQW